MGGGSAGHIYLCRMSRTAIARVGDKRILGEMERWRSCDPSATVALDGDSAEVESCCGWFRACMSTGCASPDGLEGWPSLRVEGRWKM